MRWVAVWILCGSVWMWGKCSALAQESVLDNPISTVSFVKEAIERLDPSYETFWNWGEGAFSQGVSVSLYTFESEEIPVASLRLGAGTGMILYGGVGLDAPGIARRFIPEKIKTVGGTQPLDDVWSAIGKYGRIGVVGGYSWDDQTPAYGLTFGAAFSF